MFFLSFFLFFLSFFLSVFPCFRLSVFRITEKVSLPYACGYNFQLGNPLNLFFWWLGMCPPTIVWVSRPSNMTLVASELNQLTARGTPDVRVVRNNQSEEKIGHHPWICVHQAHSAKSFCHLVPENRRPPSILHYGACKHRHLPQALSAGPRLPRPVDLATAGTALPRIGAPS